jgi:hypothetical protein
MHGKFSLRNDFAIDLRNILRSRIAKLIATVEGNEDDNDQSKEENNNPRALSFTQDIEHER